MDWAQSDKGREWNRTYIKEYRENHKKVGLCTECTRKVVPYRTKCSFHLWAGILKSRKRYIENKERCLQLVKNRQNKLKLECWFLYPSIPYHR